MSSVAPVAVAVAAAEVEVLLSSFGIEAPLSIAFELDVVDSPTPVPAP